MSCTKNEKRRSLSASSDDRKDVPSEIAQDYIGQVFRAAQAAGESPDLAEDLTQATLVTFIERLDSFEGRSHPRTWLFGILYNKIAEINRNRFREVPTEGIEELADGRRNGGGAWMQPTTPVDVQIYHGQFRAILQECLGEIPVKQRRAFVLREIEGLSTAEICRILGVSRANLDSLVCRARKRLRQSLQKRGIER